MKIFNKEKITIELTENEFITIVATIGNAFISPVREEMARRGILDKYSDLMEIYRNLHSFSVKEKMLKW